ncbi:hypothetical protein BD626DRAFT_590523 [Schizophyllum amplum]|uniref:Uncharacterized protein n=1 Tax=Schizophyllum amplum TaxID=97359 RepID=A0A550CXW7_9AGAR|nr:hypothetical protein BD626DRAFT_590523 [Auriculariopsis ampla]
MSHVFDPRNGLAHERPAPPTDSIQFGSSSAHRTPRTDSPSGTIDARRSPSDAYGNTRRFSTLPSISARSDVSGARTGRQTTPAKRQANAVSTDLGSTWNNAGASPPRPARSAARSSSLLPPSPPPRSPHRPPPNNAVSDSDAAGTKAASASATWRPTPQGDETFRRPGRSHAYPLAPPLRAGSEQSVRPRVDAPPTENAPFGDSGRAGPANSQRIDALTTTTTTLALSPSSLAFDSHPLLIPRRYRPPPLFHEARVADTPQRGKEIDVLDDVDEDLAEAARAAARYVCQYDDAERLHGQGEQSVRHTPSYQVHAADDDFANHNASYATRAGPPVPPARSAPTRDAPHALYGPHDGPPVPPPRSAPTRDASRAARPPSPLGPRPDPRWTALELNAPSAARRGPTLPLQAVEAQHAATGRVQHALLYDEPANRGDEGAPPPEDAQTQQAHLDRRQRQMGPYEVPTSWPVQVPQSLPPLDHHPPPCLVPPSSVPHASLGPYDGLYDGLQVPSPSPMPVGDVPRTGPHAPSVRLAPTHDVQHASRGRYIDPAAPSPSSGFPRDVSRAVRLYSPRAAPHVSRGSTPSPSTAEAQHAATGGLPRALSLYDDAAIRIEDELRTLNSGRQVPTTHPKFRREAPLATPSPSQDPRLYLRAAARGHEALTTAREAEHHALYNPVLSLPREAVPASWPLTVPQPTPLLDHHPPPPHEDHIAVDMLMSNPTPHGGYARSQATPPRWVPAPRSSTSDPYTNHAAQNPGMSWPPPNHPPWTLQAHPHEDDCPPEWVWVLVAVVIANREIAREREDRRRRREEEEDQRQRDEDYQRWYDDYMDDGQDDDNDYRHDGSEDERNTPPESTTLNTDENTDDEDEGRVYSRTPSPPITEANEEALEYEYEDVYEADYEVEPEVMEWEKADASE